MFEFSFGCCFDSCLVGQPNIYLAITASVAHSIRIVVKYILLTSPSRMYENRSGLFDLFMASPASQIGRFFSKVCFTLLIVIFYDGLSTGFTENRFF